MKNVSEKLEVLKKRIKKTMETNENLKDDCTILVKKIFDLELETLENRCYKICYDRGIIPFQLQVKEGDRYWIGAWALFYTDLLLTLKRSTWAKEQSMLQLKAMIAEYMQEFCNYPAENISIAELEYFQRELKSFLKKQKNIYSSMKIGYKYVTFFDYLENSQKRVSKEDTIFYYAVVQLFAETYIETILYLEGEYDPETWFVLPEWKSIDEFKLLIMNHVLV